MLASFSSAQESENKTAFNSKEHFRTVCQGSRIKIHPLIDFEYMKGWAVIVEDLITAIKKFPIQLDSIRTGSGQFDIKFHCYGRTQELKVWRAIDEAREKSRFSCMECGRGGSRKIIGNKVVVVCSECIQSVGENLETGTWLDKY